MARAPVLPSLACPVKPVSCVRQFPVLTEQVAKLMNWRNSIQPATLDLPTSPYPSPFTLTLTLHETTTTAF